jgi:ABC-type phosphate/phosphonate transport system ATPase subunit
MSPEESGASRPSDENGKLILTLSGVSIGFPGESPLLTGIDFEAHEGEVIGLVGVSGIGKTTFLRTLAGQVPPMAGQVEIFGGTSFSEAPRGSIGYIPQRLGLVHHQTVGYNVLMGALPKATRWQTLLALPSSEMRKATRAAVAAVDLEEKILEPVSQLSGGQQRRVAVARSLVQKPRLLLADECLGELDITTSEVVAEQLIHLAREHGTCVILVDHSPVRLKVLCDRVVELRSGTIREDEPDHLRLPMI